MPDPAVIFLDVDDVLNVTRTVWHYAPTKFRKDGRPFQPKRKMGSERKFNRRAIEEVNAITTSTAALFVLSSSWRLRPDARDALAAEGLAVPWHDDWCTDDRPGGRGAESTRWLSALDHPRYVIVDDWRDELHAHRGRTVFTDHAIGFTSAHRREVVVSGPAA